MRGLKQHKQPADEASTLMEKLSAAAKTRITQRATLSVHGWKKAA
jgi:hypothetical protein